MNRFIVLRRLFLILGLLYGYRAVTMFVTVLPVSDPQYKCDAKLNHTLSFTIVVTRAAKILSGFGLTMNGRHVYCGDFIYSGHTMTFVLAYLVLVECKLPSCIYVSSYLIFSFLSRYIKETLRSALDRLDQCHYRRCFVAYGARPLLH